MYRKDDGEEPANFGNKRCQNCTWVGRKTIIMIITEITTSVRPKMTYPTWIIFHYRRDYRAEPRKGSDLMDLGFHWPLGQIQQSYWSSRNALPFLGFCRIISVLTILLARFSFRKSLSSFPLASLDTLQHLTFLCSNTRQIIKKN